MELTLHNSIYVFPKGTNLHTAPRSGALFVVYYNMKMVGSDAWEFMENAFYWSETSDMSILFDDFTAGYDTMATEDGYEELTEPEKRNVDEVMDRFSRCAGLFKVSTSHLFGSTPFNAFIVKIDEKSASFWDADNYSFYTMIRLADFERAMRELVRQAKNYIRDGKVMPEVASNIAKLMGKPGLKLTDVYSTRGASDVSFVLFDRENLQSVEKAIDEWFDGL